MNPHNPLTLFQLESRHSPRLLVLTLYLVNHAPINSLELQSLNVVVSPSTDVDCFELLSTQYYSSCRVATTYQRRSGAVREAKFDGVYTDTNACFDLLEYAIAALTLDDELGSVGGQLRILEVKVA